MTNKNPLEGYYRQIKKFVSLPSGTTYYDKDIVGFTDTGEVGVMPMTGKDELMFKNPDALLNGEAISSVITSCCPSVKNAKKLLINDVNALIVAIRYASFGDSFSIDTVCPACSEKNTYSLDLDYVINNVDKLDESYVVNLDSGLSVFIKPFEYSDFVKASLKGFEQSKITRILQDNSIDDMKKFEIFGKSFNEIANLNYQLIANSIVKIIGDNGNLIVTEKEHISQFILNIDSTTVDAIEAVLKKINDIGIQRDIKAVCQKCKHEWELPIDYNPVNFFTDS